MGADLPIKPSDSSEKSSRSLKDLALIFGCSSLILSFGCLVSIPILFYFTMAMGMGADEDPFIGNLANGSMILLVISPIVVVLAGVVGIVMIIFKYIRPMKVQ
jgi:hypothetical protein